jgi:Uma2 family endonuclease
MGEIHSAWFLWYDQVDEAKMATQSRVLTSDELLTRPADGFRYELVRGELRKMAPAGFEHGGTIMNISTPLDQHVRANSLGKVYAAETGFLISSNPDTVRAPDVAFVARERVPDPSSARGYFPGPPDLAIEVISPGDSFAEVEEKVFDWINAGVRMVVTANPRNRTITAYRSLTDIVVLTEKDTLQGADIVPGWSIRVEDIFV